MTTLYAIVAIIILGIVVAAWQWWRSRNISRRVAATIAFERKRKEQIVIAMAYNTRRGYDDAALLVDAMADVRRVRG